MFLGYYVRAARWQGVKVRRCDIISESLPFNFSPHVGHMADTDLI